MEGPKSLNKLSLEEKFASLYQAEMSQLSYADLPDLVRAHFETQSAKFITPENYTVGNFSKILSFAHENGDVTFVAQQDKQFGKNGETERITYFVDLRGEDMTGYLEMGLGLTDVTDYFKGKPYVGFTRTSDGYQKEGLAERRLRQANAYALSEYGHTLNSDTIITDDTARRVWERLVDEGSAEKYMEGKNERFRFKS